MREGKLVLYLSNAYIHSGTQGMKRLLLTYARLHSIWNLFIHPDLIHVSGHAVLRRSIEFA